MNYYVSAIAGGGGDGSEGSPWTLGEVIVAINAGIIIFLDIVWVKSDGIYSTIGINITSAGSGASGYKNFFGYSTVIGDGGCPTIQRSSGSTILLKSAPYWHFKNLILDGVSGADHGLYAGACKAEKIEAKNNWDGIYAQMAINCYSHNNTRHGFGNQAHSRFNCIAESNSSMGFGGGSNFSCLSKNNTYNFYNPLNAVNCVSDGGGRGIHTTGYTTILNTIIVNVPTGHVGIYFGGSKRTVLIKNVDFFNNVSNSDDMSQIDSYYELDPQFKNPTVLDYTRTGANLNDLGFSVVGMQAPDYNIDIGVDQQMGADYPVVGNVRDGILYDNGAKIGILDLPVSGDVRFGVIYDNALKTGILDLPSVSDVQQGVIYDNGTKTGTLPPCPWAALEAHVGASYKSSTDVLEVNAWLHRDGVSVVTVTAATIDVFDETGTLWTLANNTPDANGVFWMSKTAPGLIAGELYVLKISIISPFGTTVSYQTLQAT